MVYWVVKSSVLMQQYTLAICEPGDLFPDNLTVTKQKAMQLKNKENLCRAVQKLSKLTSV